MPCDLHLELEEFVPDPGWGSWPGLDGQGRPGSVTFENDMSPCELGLMLRAKGSNWMVLKDVSENIHVKCGCYVEDALWQGCGQWG